jgi:hypothetical protein
MLTSALHESRKLIWVQECDMIKIFKEICPIVLLQITLTCLFHRVTYKNYENY